MHHWSPRFLWVPGLQSTGELQEWGDRSKTLLELLEHAAREPGLRRSLQYYLQLSSLAEGKL